MKFKNKPRSQDLLERRGKDTEDTSSFGAEARRGASHVLSDHSPAVS